MTPLRRPRLFRDHKAPLAAFVLVAMTTMFMMVHIARSEAAPAWLRHGVTTIAGGPMLAQQVLGGDLVEPAPEPAEPPVVIAAEAPATREAAPQQAQESSDATPTRTPDRGGRDPQPPAADQPGRGLVPGNPVGDLVDDVVDVVDPDDDSDDDKGRRQGRPGPELGLGPRRR